MQHRNGAAVEIAEYTAQEEQRVAQRLQGKPQKAITLQKNYQNWYNFAEEQLKSDSSLIHLFSVDDQKVLQTQQKVKLTIELMNYCY